ncbi:MAG: epimerase [Candidatus Heimdallarchaeota archaeon]|nr:epimerase [Candidatus Heimdallarchaeota archaeon]
MDILIIGGTKFLGRALVRVALDNNHNLTLFNRGKTNPDVFPEVEIIKGDRDGGLENIGDRTWDVVIDTCGYVPRIVKSSVEYLNGKVGRYVFISSISVYTESSEIDRKEDAEVIHLEDKTTEDIMGGPDNYGGLKYLCEQEVSNGFEKSLIIRPGLIVGPYDPTHRFTYWAVRIRKGGKILIPNDVSYPIQIIDVRDLAEFTIKLSEDKVTGVFNVTGPKPDITVGHIYQTSKSFSDNDPEFVKAGDSWLLDNKVTPWSEMPLWIPDASGRALMQVNIDSAIENGLTFRSLETIIRDTLDWYDDVDGKNQKWNEGLDSSKEERLLLKL